MSLLHIVLGTAYLTVDFSREGSLAAHEADLICEPPRTS